MWLYQLQLQYFSVVRVSGFCHPTKRYIAYRSVVTYLSGQRKTHLRVARTVVLRSSSWRHWCGTVNTSNQVRRQLQQPTYSQFAVSIDAQALPIRCVWSTVSLIWQTADQIINCVLCVFLLSFSVLVLNIWRYEIIFAYNQRKRRDTIVPESLPGIIRSRSLKILGVGISAGSVNRTDTENRLFAQNRNRLLASLMLVRFLWAVSSVKQPAYVNKSSSIESSSNG